MKYSVIILGLFSLAASLNAQGITAQTIAFYPVANRIFGGPPFLVSARASSGLPVSFTSNTPLVCKSAGSLVTLITAGTCSIVASQAGNGTYSAAASVTRTFTVSFAARGGSFVPAPGGPVLPGTPASAVAIGDFNGDGLPDLVVSDHQDSRITVLLNGGSGRFEPAPGSPIAFSGQIGPGPAIVADFNADGFEDLAVTEPQGRGVLVLLGNGTGSFTTANPSNYNAGLLAAGDFNGDGFLDLLSSAGILYGDGLGGFTSSGLIPGAMSVAAVADFNGDGFQDRVFSSNGVASVFVSLGNGAGLAFISMLVPPEEIVVGDFNGDGNTDFATAYYGADSLSVMLGNGAGGFLAARASSFPAGTLVSGLAVADIDGDGVQDIVVVDTDSNGIVVMRGNGFGGFAPMTGSPFAIGAAAGSIVAADLNGDGIIDLAATNYGASGISVMLGFTPGNATQTINFTAPSSVPFGIAPFTLTATASSGLPVTLVAASLHVCTVSGATVTLLSVGTCWIIASQPGDATYAPAPSVFQALDVVQGSQTITFSPLTPVSAGTTLTVSATASSGLPVSFAATTPACIVSGDLVRTIGPGTCSITATQTGNGFYIAAAPVTQSFTVTPATTAPAAVAAFLDANGAPGLTFNNSTSFPDAGGSLAGPPAVAQAPNGDVYVVGLDGVGGIRLNSYSYATGVWNGWQHSTGDLDYASGLTAAVAPNGTVWFAGRDGFYRFVINSWNGIAFGGWILLDQGIFDQSSVPQIAINSSGVVYVIGKDVGGRVWSNSFNPANLTFSGWVDRFGIIEGQPSVTAGQDGLIYMAVRGPAFSSPVYIKQIPANNGPDTTSWLNGGGLIETDPQITSQGGTVYLTALAGSGTVYLLTFTESTQTFGTWTFTSGLLNDETIAAEAGDVFIAGRDSAGRIYWYSVSENSWFFAGGQGVTSTPLAGGK